MRIIATHWGLPGTIITVGGRGIGKTAAMKKLQEEISKNEPIVIRTGGRVKFNKITSK